MEIFLSNTLSGKKEEFVPYDPEHVRMYVCGPTVYNRIHLGNARSLTVFDMLYRVLKSKYKNVIYVRNITDVDDKILDAVKDGDVGKFIKKMIDAFHEDSSSLNCLSPTFEPKATEFIDGMIKMIERLIENGNAYIKNQHVFFDVTSFSEYGVLSNRDIQELEPGARIDINSDKKNPSDFVLWKPIKEGEKIFFDSPWGKGRPGWHIECSAMSKELLGDRFDIHGGGMDLVFPHHENEIAQSKCESSTNHFAKYWIHNGFVTVNDEKMSKSLGNFITVHDLLKSGITQNALRYFYLSTHYKKPLNFSEKGIRDAEKVMKKITALYEEHQENISKHSSKRLPQDFLRCLYDDLNTPKAIAYLHHLLNSVNEDRGALEYLFSCCEFLGLKLSNDQKRQNIPEDIIKIAEERRLARKEKDWGKSDNLRETLKNLGYAIEDIGQDHEYKIVKL